MNSNLTSESRGKIGIYIIQNPATCETYIGSGVLGQRKSSHEYLLKNNKHFNYKLQRAYNRNPNFDFIGMVVDDGATVEENRLNALAIEQIDINENWGSPLLLNISQDVNANRAGILSSEETIEKNRQATTTRWQNPEWREKVIAAQNEGKANVSEEEKLAHRQKLSEAQHARYERVGSSPTKGQTRSEEFCQQNSQKITEKWQDPEYRAKQCLARQGKENVAARKQVSVDGVIYPSLTAAAQAFDITKAGALGRINSEKNQTWKYLNT